MSTRQPKPARLDFEIWSTTATLVVTEPDRRRMAEAELAAELTAIESACSRFRGDSEVNRLLRSPGVEVNLSPVLNAAIAAALRVAAATSYLVDPTVAAAVIALGYDRDISALRSPSPIRPLTGRRMEHGMEHGMEIATAAARPAPGAWRIQHDADRGLITVPAGVGLDLGATAKALAADRAAARIADRTGCGVLVGLGGDIAVAGKAPAGGWGIAIADDHRTAETAPMARVAISSGGLATSSIVTRRWRTANGPRHHLIDPRTGENPDPLWRTASVAAGSALDANAAATAAIILGAAAPTWLAEQHLATRLVDVGGAVVSVAGWPDDSELAA